MWSDAAPVAPMMRVAPKKAKMDAVSIWKTTAVLRALLLGPFTLGCSSSSHPLAGPTGQGGRGGCQVCNPGASVPGCQ